MNLFTERFEYFVGEELVQTGSGIYSEPLPLTSGSRYGSDIPITLRIATHGVSEPGVDLRANVLIGDTKQLQQISTRKKQNDRLMNAWLTLPKLTIALLIAFGTVVFSFPQDYIFFIIFAVLSALKIPEFYGMREWLPANPMLSRTETFILFDIAAQISFSWFVHYYFRQRSTHQRLVLQILTGASILGYGALLALADTAVFFYWGYTIARLLQFGAVMYALAASLQVFLHLRGSQRSLSRQLISASIAGASLAMLVYMSYTWAASHPSWMGMMVIEMAFTLVFAACVATDTGHVRTERDSLRRALGVFVDEGLVHFLMNRKHRPQRHENAAILFVDLRSFTEITDTFDAEEVLELLNGYYDVVVDAIQREGGVVNKFVGDAVLGVWGIGDDREDTAVCSMRAAVAIRQGLRALNLRRAEQGTFPISWGIGVHVGSVLGGMLGSEKRAEYTVIGTTVNMASRLQELTKRLGFDILISRAALEKVRGRVAAATAGEQIIRGSREVLEVYALLGYVDAKSGDVITADPQFDLLGIDSNAEVLDHAPRNFQAHDYSSWQGKRAQ